MEPRLIEFPVHPDPTGNLAVADYNDLPFEVKRVFWIYDIIGERGDHALKTCHQLVIPMSGTMLVETLCDTAGKFDSFRSFMLYEKHVGLYIPPMVWRRIVTTSESVAFVLCSHPFDEDDYIDGVVDFEEALMENEMTKGLKFADEILECV